MFKETYGQSLKAGASIKMAVFTVIITISYAFELAAAADIGADEIIFASRQPGVGGHWYENFGYYVQDEKKWLTGRWDACAA